jgi:tetratricopeptide (TPR) repeat protein
LAAVALLEVTRGAALDPAAQRCFGRDEALRMDARDPLSHISFHDEPWEVGTRWMHTHGLQKFSRPELELVAVPASLAAEGQLVLRDLATNLAHGERLAAGDEIELDEAGKLLAVNAQADMDHQSPTGRLRLVDAPLPGERIGQRIARVLRLSALAEAGRRLDSGDVGGAEDSIERALADDPDDCSALALKARIALQRGDAIEALDLGEFIRVRVPEDFRGPLTVGKALAALGRYPEALHALDHAIELEPEAAEAFSERAEVHEWLGHEQLASVDRAHASYLSH